MTTKKLEPKQLLDRMRNEAAELLKYDLNNLTAAQSVRLDRAAALRLELDDVQSRQLAGLPIDMAKFVVASEALERLVGGNPETSTTGHDFSGAREELRALFDRRADALERNMARDPASARRKFEDKLQAAIAKHNKTIPKPGGGDDAKRDRVGVNDEHCSPFRNSAISSTGISKLSDPGSGDAQSGDGVSLPPSAAPDAPAAGSEPPLLVSPAPPPPPAPLASAAERQANVERLNSQPANPAPGPPEPWRSFVDESGIHTSPWRR